MSGITNTTLLPINTTSMYETSAQHLARQDETAAAGGPERPEEKAELPPQRGPFAPNVDKYIHSDETASAGLYRKGKDDEGNPTIIFDNPARKTMPMDSENTTNAMDKKDSGEEPAKAKDSEGGVTRCDMNADKVEEEIKKLKEKKAELEQQIAKAAENPDTQAKLEKKLQQIENEIKVKDTDSYKRQHTEYTYTEIS